jgi:hypothetical protein
MEVLNAMLKKAEQRGLFQQLQTWGVTHSLSLFADDAALFLRPVHAEVLAAKEILELLSAT